MLGPLVITLGFYSDIKVINIVFVTVFLQHSLPLMMKVLNGLE